MVRKFGIPNSISETYYLLQEENKSGILFTLSLWGIAIPLMPVFIEASNLEYTQCLAWIPCSALCFVATAPEFKKGLDRTIHICATVICALCSQAWVAIYHPYLLFLWFIPVIGIGLKVINNIKKNNKDRENANHPIYWERPLFFRCNQLFWVEITAFTITYIALAL